GLAVNVVKDKIEEAIIHKMDVERLSSTANTINIADLGCAVGPNTFLSVQNILDCIERKYRSQCPNRKTPEFSVFFNDLPENDFNTLFRSLPGERRYFAAGVPGSFHRRLFPESSLHYVHCAVSLHWLSRVPEELLREGSATWNKGRVHYTSAPDEVVGAYRARFAADMDDFLRVRAKEVVVGGLMVIIMAGIPHGMPHAMLPAGVMYDLLGSALLEMAREGVIPEEQVDMFNLPIYAASPQEMREIVERDGSFSIEAIDLANPSPWLTGPVDMQEWTDHVRAAMEPLFATQFRNQAVVDEIFDRLVRKLVERSREVESSYREKIQLYVILRRV
ncbi:uncharacterized protein J3R85_007945, partial [Psidium guajava]